ncbi:MAG: D-2-hydroxyacid dehydrogenase [Clostridiales bacterium]|nr:D-2-hydroxyacid dehydrogenase [Clostridiales bacterium]
MKITVLDSFALNPGDLSWDWLRELGDCYIYDRTPLEKVLERSKDAEIIITNKTVLSAETMKQLPDLKFIALESTGYNICDIDYAKSRGIPVCNIPSYSTEAVAQLTFALILETTNSVGIHSDSVHKGDWVNCPDFCYWKTPLTELSGKTIGIVGFGKIGQRVADIAQAFNMKVLAVSGHESDQSFRKNFKWTSLDEIKKNSDIISFHCPLTKDTENLLDDKFVEDCKQGVIIINTSRGPVVNSNALANGLNEGKIGAAGLDVLTVEPPKADNPLLTAKNCYITPHIAWAGFETRERLMKILEENVKGYLNGKIQNRVN